MTRAKESPSQTAGPYVHIGCVPQTAGLEPRAFGAQLGSKMVFERSEATIDLDIMVWDGAGELVKDALIEIWQRGPNGEPTPSNRFSNWGRQATDLNTGVARFQTRKPATPKGQAPHILIWIVARGINLGLTTRLYFPDEDNTADPVFQLAGDRATTLVAIKTATGYAHKIHLQGAEETVFFDV